MNTNKIKKTILTELESIECQKIISINFETDFNSDFNSLSNFGMNSTQKIYTLLDGLALTEVINKINKILFTNLKLLKSNSIVKYNSISDYDIENIYKLSNIKVNKILNDTNMRTSFKNSDVSISVYYDRGFIYHKLNTNIDKLKLNKDRFVEICTITKLNNLHYNDTTYEVRFNVDSLSMFINYKKELTDIDYYTSINNIIKDYLILEKIDNTKLFNLANILLTIFTNIKYNDDTSRGLILESLLRKAQIKLMELKYDNKFKITGLVKPILDSINCMDGKYDNYNIDDVFNIISLDENKSFINMFKGKSYIDKLLISEKSLTGEMMYDIYSTYGIPIEYLFSLFNYYEKENNIYDFFEFKKEDELKNKRNENIDKFKNIKTKNIKNKSVAKYIAYRTTKVMGVIGDGIILKETPFLPESKEHIADKGFIKYKNQKEKFEVLDVIKLKNDNILHILNCNPFNIGDSVVADIDIDRRHKISANHTSLYILKWVLLKMFNNISIISSKVTDKYLKLDFMYDNTLTDNDILNFEKDVNDIILQERDIKTFTVNKYDAKKYGIHTESEFTDLISIDKLFTIQCEGTHVPNTKILNKFGISSFEKKGKNKFRIISHAYKSLPYLEEKLQGYDVQINNQINKALDLLNIGKINDVNIQFNFAVNSLLQYGYRDVINKRRELSLLKKKTNELKNELYSALYKKADLNVKYILNTLRNKKLKKNNKNVILVNTENVKEELLNYMADKLTKKVQNGIVYMMNIDTIDKPKLKFVVKSSNYYIPADKLAKSIALIISGKSGGNKKSATGGSSVIINFDMANTHVKNNILVQYDYTPDIIEFNKF